MPPRDRERSRSINVLPSLARTANPTAVVLDNDGYHGVIVTIDVSAISATPSITVTVSYQDPVTGQFRSSLASAAITTVSTVFLRIGPGLPVTANQSANEMLGSKVRVSVAHGDADEITYQINAEFIKF